MRNNIVAVAVGLTALCFSGAFSQSVELGPQNKTVELDQNVILECQFNQEVSCMWSRGGAGTPEEISGRYRFVSGTGLEKRTDCSIEITQIQASDLGQWGCATYRVTPAVAWLSQQKTPSPPKIYFMGKELKELVFPIPNNKAHASNLSCISERGNPLPKLSWEMDKAPIPGNTENITITEDLFSTRLTWNQGDWSRFNQNGGPLRCILEHPAYDMPQTAAVTFIQEYATKNVQIRVEGLSGSTFELGHNEQLVFTCTADGQPKPTVSWEFLPAGEKEWMPRPESGDSLVLTEPKDGLFRCLARNRLNAQVPVRSQEYVVKPKTAVEASNFGMVVGIIIGCLVLLALIGLLVVFLYRRKKWIFAPKSDSTPVNVDAEAADHENEKPTEKTPLESVPDPQYENLKQNGKEEEINGKTDTSPIKNDQNDNKKSTEVVYAQLDLSKRGVAKVKPLEYEKTEYAEITFNKDKGNDV